MSRLLGPTLILAVLALTACGGGAAPPTPAPSDPSGSLGVMTAEAGTEALAALCQLRSATDRDTANGLFFDRAHLTLHVLAAATEPVDRVPAAGLLETKQIVEADLQADALPHTFSDDVEALIEATGTALDTVGLPSPDC